MKRGKTASGLLAIAVTLGLARAPARAADEPLLVVVEAPPSLEIDAAEVRRTVASELHVRTLAPIKPGQDAPDRALIVALDQDHIAMSFRTGDAPAVVRTIPAPLDHAGRLQAIAWLAGNLARDQVSPIVAQIAVEPAPEAPPPPPAAPPPPTEPPPVPAAPSRPETPVVIHVDHHEPVRRSHWTLGASMGPIFAVVQSPAQGAWPPGLASYHTLAWQLELLRRRDDERMILGVTVEGTQGHSLENPYWTTTSGPPQLIGAHAFAGKDWRHRRLAFETTLGLGLEAAQVQNTTSPYALAIGYYWTYQLGLYAQASAAGAFSVSRSFDIVLRLGVHLTPSHDENWFAASMLGVRWRLP